MTAPEFARGVLCTHDRYETLETVNGSVFDDHDTFYIQCRECHGFYVITAYKSGREDWSPMTSSDMLRFAEPEPETDRVAECALCGEKHPLVTGATVCVECWIFYEEPDANRVDSIMEDRWIEYQHAPAFYEGPALEAMRDAGR